MVFAFVLFLQNLLQNIAKLKLSCMSTGSTKYVKKASHYLIKGQILRLPFQTDIANYGVFCLAILLFDFSYNGVT